MNNNAFNFRRFWQTLKWTVLTERKSILTAAAAFVVAFLAIQLFMCFTIFDLDASMGPEAALTAMGICSALLSFMTAYYVSGLLGNARQSRQRTTVLMLPASNAEKFTARIVYCCILMPLLLVAALAVATWLRMLLELMAGHAGIVSGVAAIETQAEPINWFFFISATLWQTSIFLLGGVFFHQRPFVWTNIVLLAGSLLLFTLGFYTAILIGEEAIKNFIMQFDTTIEAVELTVSLILTAFAVLNIWLSYRLYCRLQVVQHKWFNV